jgi:hypothetical protein
VSPRIIAGQEAFPRSSAELCPVAASDSEFLFPSDAMSLSASAA